jgi:cytochrome c-type biogenesis protein CcmH/NrfG
MLFDLRGRGRRRTVQVIYLSLAILMGGGLVLFGIGGATSGGLFDAFTGDNSTSSSGTEALERTVTSATAATERNPQDARAWAQLVRARFQLAGADGGVDENTGAFTAKGKRRLVAVERAWDRYIALDPNPPDDVAATYMVQAFSNTGLNKPEKAVRALEMVIEVRGDNSNLYSQLAVLAYQAGQTRKGDLSADKAVQLAPAADRKLLRENLEEAKQQIAAEATPQQTVTATPSPTTTTGATSTTG